MPCDEEEEYIDRSINQMLGHGYQSSDSTEQRNRHCKLYRELFENGRDIERDMSNFYKNRIDELTQMLCEIFTQNEDVITVNKKAWQWWDEHKKWDERRENELARTC